jgi:hypothetical protein
MGSYPFLAEYFARFRIGHIRTSCGRELARGFSLNLANHEMEMASFRQVFALLICGKAHYFQAVS